jgi:endoglucanase
LVELKHLYLTYIVGGLYHDDGYVKHGLPTAAAATMMLWGLVDYKKAYEATGEISMGKKQLKWILDYYMKTHTSKYELYVQVGDIAADERYWGRSEEMEMDRPAYKIDADHPGSDVAGEIAASFAAGSIVYQDEGTV